VIDKTPYALSEHLTTFRKGRRCLKCSRPLSIYNPDEYCFSMCGPERLTGREEVFIPSFSSPKRRSYGAEYKTISEV